MEVYDDYNTRIYADHFDGGTYICCNCGRLVSLEGSISSRGKHLLCRYCVSKIAKILNITRDEVMNAIHNTKE